MINDDLLLIILRPCSGQVFLDSCFRRNDEK